MIVSRALVAYSLGPSSTTLPIWEGLRVPVVHDPPHIEGYEYVRPIGRGGFSDVYLYTQRLPFREVAIKVLHTDSLTDAVRRQFEAEINLMARVSNHTNIVSIYAADIDEEGEPYLVMEYCAGGSLGEVYRQAPLPLRDVLRIGVRLASALEVAHRSGIVHRDIKPSNILLSEYGMPVLSDFGISTIDDEFPDELYEEFYGERGDEATTFALSLPWAAPETLRVPPDADPRSDRYALAATLYSLLEGRSPHEVPGGPNTSEHLRGRIQSGFIAAMKHAEIPESLTDLLRQAMAFDPAVRHDHTVDFGSALQQIQRDLGHDVTPMNLPLSNVPEPTPPDIADPTDPDPAEIVELPVDEYPVSEHTLMPPRDPR